MIESRVGKTCARTRAPTNLVLGAPVATTYGVRRCGLCRSVLVGRQSEVRADAGSPTFPSAIHRSAWKGDSPNFAPRGSDKLDIPYAAGRAAGFGRCHNAYERPHSRESRGDGDVRCTTGRAHPESADGSWTSGIGPGMGSLRVAGGGRGHAASLAGPARATPRPSGHTRRARQPGTGRAVGRLRT